MNPHFFPELIKTHILSFACVNFFQMNVELITLLKNMENNMKNDCIPHCLLLKKRVCRSDNINIFFHTHTHKSSKFLCIIFAYTSYIFKTVIFPIISNEIFTHESMTELINTSNIPLKYR